MITRATARKHLRRLESLRGAPNWKWRDDDEKKRTMEQLAECVNAFLEAARDEAHATRIGDHLVATCLDFFPSAGRILSAASATREMPLFRSRKREFDCPKCEDTGWKQVKGGLYPASVKCDHKQEPDPVDTVPAGMADEELGV